MHNTGKRNLYALPNQSAEELNELKQKIRIHRMKILIIFLVILGIVIGVIGFLYLYFERKQYHDYEVIEKIERNDTQAAEYEDFQGNVLQYTKDGAVYSDLSGNIIWNQTYEMQSPRIATCQNYLAIYEQGGSKIYIMDTSGSRGTINTSIAIQRVSIASEGTVAVLMENDGTGYIHIYEKSGKQLASGELHIENSGYPLDIAISNDAGKLAVTMLDINEGNVKSAVVFYNYGTVGQNEIDNIVGSYSYSDMVIPSIRFVSNNRLLAFGDKEVIIFEGTQKPEVVQEISPQENIRSIYYNDKYFGIAYDDLSSAKKYHTDIYNMKGKCVLQLEFELDYTDISFLENNLICIRNEKDCLFYTLRGNKRFEYTFDRSIYHIISGKGQQEFLLILNGETDRIKLKDSYTHER